jgi:transcriptional regulator with XRE-family HTH domain
MQTLKEWRDKKSVSMRDLSALTKKMDEPGHTGITTSTIFNIENGKLETKPTKRTIRLLALALGVDPADISF